MIWPALILGAAGSLHCLGMCGPIALALPGNATSRGEYITGRLAYNLGRVITYAALGTFFGLLGQSFVLAGWQQALSIVCGIIMLVSIWGASAYAFIPSWYTKALGGLWKKLFARRSVGGLLVIGLFNGLLPCGLVYAAIAGAAAAGSPADGALFMAVFGIGTIPAMLAVALAGKPLRNVMGSRLRRAVPIAATVVALLIVIRGLGLGIPYVSPAFHEGDNVPACCRHGG